MRSCCTSCCSTVMHSIWHLLLTVRTRLTVPTAGHKRKHNACRADVGGHVSGYTYSLHSLLSKLCTVVCNNQSDCHGIALHASSLFLPMSRHLWSLAVTQTSLLFAAQQHIANAAHHQEDSDLVSLDTCHVFVQPVICGVPIVWSVVLICMLG